MNSLKGLRDILERYCQKGCTEKLEPCHIFYYKIGDNRGELLFELHEMDSIAIVSIQQDYVYSDFHFAEIVDEEHLNNFFELLEKLPKKSLVP